MTGTNFLISVFKQLLNNGFYRFSHYPLSPLIMHKYITDLRDADTVDSDEINNTYRFVILF